MDCVDDNSANSTLLVNEGSEKGYPAIKEEKQPLLGTLNETRSVQSDEKSNLRWRKNDPEAKGVFRGHESRIKSFCGWKSNAGKGEYAEEQNGRNLDTSGGNRIVELACDFSKRLHGDEDQSHMERKGKEGRLTMPLERNRKENNDNSKDVCTKANDSMNIPLEIDHLTECQGQIPEDKGSFSLTSSEDNLESTPPDAVLQNSQGVKTDKTSNISLETDIKKARDLKKPDDSENGCSEQLESHLLVSSMKPGVAVTAKVNASVSEDAVMDVGSSPVNEISRDEDNQVKTNENGIVGKATVDEVNSENESTNEELLVIVDANPEQGPEFENEIKNNASGTEENSKIDAFRNENKGTVESADIRYHSIDQLDRSIADEETVCGFGSFKPQWIQKFVTAKCFLFLFSLVGVMHGTYYTYFVSIISTLEKRYGLETKVTSSLMLAEELLPLFFGVSVGYIGGRVHRPRWIAIGMFLIALCCFVSGLPYFIYGPSEHLMFQNVKTDTTYKICESDENREACNVDDRPSSWAVVCIILFANFLKGFSNLTYQCFGISYMDDNSKKKNTPMYLAVALALRLLGPLVGFLMSSAFLKIYENPFEDPGFGPDDPRWIGAWWMGFFLQGVLLVIFTLPIALFPRRLPSQKKLENFHPVGKKESMKETLAGLLSALKRLGKNPIFIIMIVNTTMKIFGHFGHSIMLPKYMENQFRLSAADASLFSGATSITCVMLSTVLGGFLIWKFRPRVKLLLAGMVISEIILCIGFLILMIPRCQPADMLHFGMNDEGLILDNVCNQNCDCSTTSFTPFCGPDGKTTYFSPCYAGCTQELKSVMSSGSKRHKEFGNCSCISVTDSTESIPAKITEGFCPDENCWSQTLAYLIILFVLLMISNTLTVAHTMILLRSVHPGDKSVALGTFETFICLFGFIPFPVTFGALVDSACLVWEESCGETGNCWFYDMEKYGYLLHGAAALFCSLSIVCLITLYLLSDRVRNLYAEETEEEDHIDNIKLDTVSGSVTKL